MTPSYSYSQLSTAYKCGQLYKYLFIDKIKSTDPESGDMKFGTGIHMAIEAMLTNPGCDYAGLFDLYWNIEKTHDNKYGRFNWSDLRDQGHMFLARFERLHAKKYQVLEMEQRYHGTIGDIRVEGTPDFIGLYEGTESVVDFKTSGSRYNKDKAKISEQLYLYAHLANQAISFVAKQIVYVVFVKGPTPSIQCIIEPISERVMSGILSNIRQQGLDLNSKTENNSFTRNHSACIMGEYKCSFFKNCHGEGETNG